MNKFIAGILNLGTRNLKDQRSVSQVRFSNILAYFVILFVLLFFVFNAFFAEDWNRAKVTLVILPIAVASLILNLFGLHHPARVLVAFLPMLASVGLPPLAYYVQMTMDNAVEGTTFFHVVHGKMASVGTAICPFVLLDLRKRINKIIVPFLIFGLLMSIDPLYSLVNPAFLEQLGINAKEGGSINFVMFSSASVIILCVFFMANLNIGYEDKLLMMNEELNRKSTKLKNEVDLRRSSELEMQSAKDKTEAAMRSRTAFFAQMNHEIRTPLHGILGLTDLLGKTKDDAENEKLFRSIRVSASELMRLLNNILDLNKIESEKFDVTNRNFRLYDLMTSIKDAYPPGIFGPNHDFVFRIDSGSEESMIADDLRITQVLNNLLINGIKHSGATVFEISLAEMPERNSIRFSVSDNGKGISSDLVDDIMKEHFSGANGQRTNFGLGLFISQKILMAMGSKLILSKSTLGGSEFSFEIPRTPN